MYQANVYHFALLILVLSSFGIQAETPHSSAISSDQNPALTSKNTFASKRRVVEVGISMSIPPWVIKENDSGIELDILRASLPDQKYDIRPTYLPFARAYKQFEAELLDIVMNAKANVAQGGFLSEPVVTFQNYAISLKRKDFPKDIEMNFLHDRQVIGFQKARAFLGEEFAHMANINPRYQEVAKQRLQINLLFLREVDFIVMDRSIFGYYWYQASQSDGLTPEARRHFQKPVRFHPLFEKSPYPFLFRDKTLRDEFDRGLARIRKSGRYDEILEKYDHLSDMYEQR